MLKRAHLILTGVLCALLFTGATSGAHAAEREITLRAGEIEDYEIYEGSKTNANKVMKAWVDAIHTLEVDEDDEDERAWVIRDADDETTLVEDTNPKGDYDRKLTFKGKVKTGTLKGAQVSGQVCTCDDGSYWLQMRVTTSTVDVYFAQALEVVDGDEGGEGGEGPERPEDDDEDDDDEDDE